MLKITLKFDGNITDFQKAFDSMDDSFDIRDNIFYIMDYNEKAGIHITEFGDIKITFTEDE